MMTYTCVISITRQHTSVTTWSTVATWEKMPRPLRIHLTSTPFLSETLKRLAIGSDAWMEEQALLDQVWGLKPPAGLQLQMNRWSDARHLKDDASMIVVELETTTRGE